MGVAAKSVAAVTRTAVVADTVVDVLKKLDTLLRLEGSELPGEAKLRWRGRREGASRWRGRGLMASTRIRRKLGPGLLVSGVARRKKSDLAPEILDDVGLRTLAAGLGVGD